MSVTSVFTTDLWESLRYVVLYIVNFTRRNIISLLLFSVVVLGFLVGWSEYQHSRTKEISFFVGPAGSDGWDDARKIAERIHVHESSLGTRYTVRPVYTDGFEENRQFVSRDANSVGFAHDGFGDSSGLGILLPLEDSYVHILCTRRFLKANKLKAEEKEALHLKDVVPHLSPGKVYLGPTESGTRQAAEIILQNCGVDAAKLSTNGIADFNEMRAALLNDSIEAAFYCGPVGAHIIRQIASDETCQLVGLAGMRDAITQHNRQMSAVDFMPNSFLNGSFCPNQVPSVATRRVIICSQDMPADVAFILGKCASEVMRDRIGTLQWRAGSLANSPSTDFTYPLHKAAELLKTDSVPDSQFTRWSLLGWTIAAWVFTGLLRDFASGVSKKERQQQQAGSAAELEAKLWKSKEELIDASADAEPTVLDTWRKRLQTLSAEINDAEKGQKITSDEARDYRERVWVMLKMLPTATSAQLGLVQATAQIFADETLPAPEPATPE